MKGTIPCLPGSELPDGGMGIRRSRKPDLADGDFDPVGQVSFLLLRKQRPPEDRRPVRLCV